MERTQLQAQREREIELANKMIQGMNDEQLRSLLIFLFHFTGYRE